MEKTTVLRLVLLLGFLAFMQCEEERVFRIKIMEKDKDNDVYRNAYYTEKNKVKLSCFPPKEPNDKYEEISIVKGNGTKPSEVVICKTSDNTNTCKFTPGADPSLAVEISEAAVYTCRYVKQPEPPVKDESVHVYFKSQPIKVFGENDVPVTDMSLQVTNGTSYRLACPDAGQTGTKVHWYRNEHELKFDHGNPFYELNDTTNNLTFKTVKNPDASKFGGWYRCERISKDGVPLTTGFVKVNSHAFASAASKSYNKMEGDSATLSCDIDGEPVPKVSWRRDSTVLGNNPDDSKRITFSSYKGIPNASITIKNLVAEDYGEYTCVAQSDDGSLAEAVILLRVRSKLAALWPFLGIVAEVIVLVAIIFIYERRRAKKEQEENEDAADQKKSLTASNNENKDVRQRKA